MIPDTSPSRQPPTGTPRQTVAEGSYIDWAAILAGAVFALAVAFLLISFGAGLGLSLASPYRGEGISAAWFVIAAGIWLAWVLVSGFGAGGYLAGRMRRRAGDATPGEVEARDGAHGLMVWATGALVGMVLANMGIGGLVVAGVAATGTTGEISTEAAASDYFANLMLRGPTSEPAPQAEAATTATPEDTATPAPEGPSTAAAAAIDPDIQRQVAAILGRSAAEAEMQERDSRYLAQVVAANTGLDPAAARTRVDQVNAEIAEARATALATVERARVAGVVFGFIAAATLLAGAVAAFLAAAVGGRHRDEGLGSALFADRR